jgi:hypothetical protein
MPDEPGNDNPGIQDGELTPVPEPENVRKAACPACSTPDTLIFTCSVCGKEFCEKCPGNHSPLQNNSFESKVHFMYRVRGAGIPWKEDVVRFSDEVPAPLCSACWDNECNKMIWRFKNKIKNWKQDVLRDEELRVLEESLPACGIADQKIVKSALDFLGELQRTNK